MSKKIEISLAAAAVAVSLAAWLFPISASQSVSTAPSLAQAKRPLLDRLLPTAVLQISGTGANVRIRKGPAGARYEGGEVSATGADSVVYLSPGQPLKLEVSGTGAEVLIESELMPHIQVTNTATGASVETF
jgi:hypothetical protein